NFGNGYPFSADGKRLVTADGRVRDASSGKEIIALQGFATANSPTFSPDGAHIAAPRNDGTVVLWDAATGQLSARLRPHSSQVISVAFSADGKRLASGASDEMVRICDVTAGQEALVLKGHGGRASCVAFSPKGNRLASAGGQSVKLWDADT